MKHERKSARGSTHLAPLSRRGFFRLNAALIAAASTTSCTWRQQPLDTRRGLQLLRAEDLLSLRVEFTNLAITHRYLKPARLVRELASQPARVTFVLPTQHVSEQFFTAADTAPTLPVLSSAAQPSSLTFEWPANLEYIDLTIDQLLDWGAWQYVAERSTIEVPAGMTLAPESPTQWSHARRPVTHRGRSELWHTRLLADAEQADNPRVTIALANSSQCDDTIATPDFERVPNGAERCAVDGRQADLRTLMLSPMGAWLDLRGSWDSGAVRRWEHRTTAGQDQRVLVEGQEGFLFPFGHRASIITVTERQLNNASLSSGASRRAAVLQQRRFIVIKQPERNYAPGATVFQKLLIRQEVTPPLSGNGAANPNAPFWVESGGAPYAFNFDADDWASHAVTFSANTVFVPGTDDDDAQRAMVRDAIQLHAAGGERRLSSLAGQAVVVAPYQTTTKLDATRTEGDTTLQLLQLEHEGVASVQDDTPFTWRSAGMQARIPALTNNLAPDKNTGWFDYLSPEPEDGSNAGEVFAVARKASGLIAMQFSDRTDRSGGIVAPSIDVEGISRIYGPVGNVASVRDSGDFAPGSYFSSDAQMLGGFGLNNLGQEKSVFIPQLFFDIKREEYKDKKWYEETDEDRSAPKRFKTTVEGGLKWEFPLPDFDISLGIIELRAQLEDEKSLSKLTVKTAVSKTFGPAKKAQGDSASADSGNATESSGLASRGIGDSDVEVTEEQETETDVGSTAANGEQGQSAANKTPPVDWSATATLSRFDLVLNAALLGSLTFGFDTLSAKIGSPKPKTKTDAKPASEPSEDDTSNENESEQAREKPPLSKELKCELNGISGTGALVMVGPLLLLAKKLSESVETEVMYGYSSPPAPYPASVPSVSDADISFNIGPVAMSDIKIGTFSVSDVSVSFGVGFYLFPRKVKGTDNEFKVPGNRLSAGFGTTEKPLTVLQEPWGGFAHMALSVDFGRGLSGFQFGLGIACGTIFDFKLGKAKCLGSLSVIYTYVNTQDTPNDNSVTLMLRIDGKAHIAGWIDVTLRISASGTVGTQGWVFEVTIKVQVKIAFFTVGVSLELRHVISNEEPKTLGATAQSLDLSRDEWLKYQAAFADTAAA